MNTPLTDSLLSVDTSPLDAAGFTPYYLQLPGLNQGRPTLDRMSYYDLASNDYLGLASDPRVKDAMISAVLQYGSSMCGTPIATGHVPLLAQLEDELARFVGVENIVVLPSCYQANLALFPAIAGREDLVIVDHYAHASLGQGIKACGARIQPFLHNDLEHLERLLSKAGRGVLPSKVGRGVLTAPMRDSQELVPPGKYRRVFVVTESVFSTEGSVAPVREIVRLCSEHSAIPVIDDSHGLGVLGKDGGGILQDQDAAGFDGIYTASLGKAFAQTGGIIGGSRSLIQSLRYTLPGLIYSTALVPASAAGALQALHIIRDEFAARHDRLIRHHRRLVSKLEECGYVLARGAAPIAAVRCGSVKETLAVARHFYEHRILTTPFVPPSVPPGQGIVRLIVGGKLDETGFRELLERIHPFPGYSLGTLAARKHPDAPTPAPTTTPAEEVAA